MVEQKPKTQNSDSKKSINRRTDAIAGIANEQSPQLATMLKPVTTKTLTFDGKNEKFELSEDRFHACSNCNEN